MVHEPSFLHLLGPKVKWGQGRGNGATFWIKKNQNCFCAVWCVEQHLAHGKYRNVKRRKKRGKEGRKREQEGSVLNPPYLQEL